MQFIQGIIDSLDGIIKNIVNGVNDIANEIFTFIIMMLPTSPFYGLELDPIILNFLGYFNYYCPMSVLLSIMVSWLTCIATYYAYQLILRLIKAVS